MPRFPIAALGLAAAATVMSAPLWAQGSSSSRSVPPACSLETLPPAEKAAMEKEYAQRTRADGKAKADAWLREQARAFLAQLVDEGVCTMDSPAPDTQVATRSRPSPSSSSSSSKTPVGKDGKPCKRTRMANRAVANVGGGPMTMVLVPVCAD